MKDTMKYTRKALRWTLRCAFSESLKLCVLATALAMFGLLFMAQTSLADSANNTQETSEKMLKLSAFNAPQTFWDELRKDELGERVEREWGGFWDADVWVYFLKDQSEIARLGATEQHVLRMIKGSSDGTFIHNVGIELADQRSVALFFIYVSAFTGHSESVMVCKAVHGINANLRAREAPHEVRVQDSCNVVD